MTANHKAKFLLVRIRGLNEELKITKETYSHADTGFQKAFNEKYFPEKAQPNEEDAELSTGKESPEQKHQQKQEQQFNEQPPPADETVSASKNEDPQMKKMFRNVAKEAHPDKLASVSESERERKKELYSTAVAAFENDDFATLYSVCEELGIDLPDVDEDKVRKMEDQVSSVKKEINKLKSTFMWQWLFAATKEQKDNLVEQLFQRMYPRP